VVFVLLGCWTALVGAMLSTCKGNVLISRWKPTETKTNKQTNQQTTPPTNSQVLQTWIEPWRKPKISHRKRNFAFRHNCQGHSQFHSSSSVVDHWYGTIRGSQTHCHRSPYLPFSRRTVLKSIDHVIQQQTVYTWPAVTTFLCFSQQTAIISLKSSSRFGFVVEWQCSLWGRN